jgi:hypothetical protein
MSYLFCPFKGLQVYVDTLLDYGVERVSLYLALYLLNRATSTPRGIPFFLPTSVLADFSILVTFWDD